jgi:hypothetical protein
MIYKINPITGEVIKFNNVDAIGADSSEWLDATQEQIDDQESLQNKASQIAQAKLNRDNLQYANIEYKNSIFKANSDTQAKMTARALSIELEAKSGVDLALIEVIWYDINDEAITWTAIEFMGLFKAVLTRANTLYAECNATVNAIKNPA